MVLETRSNTPPQSRWGQRILAPTTRDLVERSSSLPMRSFHFWDTNWVESNLACEWSEGGCAETGRITAEHCTGVRPGPISDMSRGMICIFLFLARLPQRLHPPLLARRPLRLHPSLLARRPLRPAGWRAASQVVHF